MSNIKKLLEFIANERGLVQITATFQNDNDDLETKAGLLLDMINAQSPLQKYKDKVKDFHHIGLKNLKVGNLQEIVDCAFTNAIIDYMDIYSSGMSNKQNMSSYNVWFKGKVYHCAIGQLMSDDELNDLTDEANNTDISVVEHLIDEPLLLKLLSNVQGKSDYIFIQPRDVFFNEAKSTIKYLYRTLGINSDFICSVIDECEQCYKL